MIKNVLKTIVAFPNNICNFITLKRKRVDYGKNLKISGRISIHGKGKITLVDNITIMSSVNSNSTSGFNKCHLTSYQNAEIIIGNNVGMSNVNISSSNKIVIEDNVLLGSGVKIWDTDFHSISYDKRIHSDLEIKTSPVYILEGAFIGACSIILKGVTIGKHSIIGAGSVVTHNVPDNEIWAGNPAKFIRKIDEQ